MDIKDAKNLLNDYVQYKPRYSEESKIFILNGLILKKEDGKFIYYAELLDKTGNCLVRDYLSKIEEI